jgi:hypothetical protein
VVGSHPSTAAVARLVVPSSQTALDPLCTSHH